MCPHPLRRITWRSPFVFATNAISEVPLHGSTLSSCHDDSRSAVDYRPVQSPRPHSHFSSTGPMGAVYPDQCACSLSMFCRPASLSRCILPYGVAPFTSCVRDTRRVLGGSCSLHSNPYTRKPMFPSACQSAALCSLSRYNRNRIAAARWHSEVYLY